MYSEATSNWLVLRTAVSASYNVGAHTEAFQVKEDIGDADDENDEDEGDQPSTAATELSRGSRRRQHVATLHGTTVQ